MNTKHMNEMMFHRGIDEHMVAVIEKYGEFNHRGDRIILSRKMIKKLLGK